ncbi:hypothetical protein MHL31_12630 [Lutibacter sp. A80]|uniref:hypothetical protein n=1 Tax=Lutibacter sp. A80 TaxID=2918453 RepID=UPI001F058AEE|nr:hypothetical protein [Lutibacter sp. A80]UMB59916.1 hypothetical protein MHL31_12630 [Lutibacter sp. A80]
MIWLWGLTGITIGVFLFSKFTGKLNDDLTLNATEIKSVEGYRILQIIIFIVGILITYWIFSLLFNS